MDARGQVYFDDEHRISDEDKARLAKAMDEMAVQEAAARLAKLERELLAKEFPKHYGPGFPD